MNPVDAIMNGLEVYITDTTCGEACWRALEDICRCSCSGRNHGCMRDENGVRPARTSKIKGYVYQLLAVGTYGNTEKQADEIKRRCLDEELVPVKVYGGGYRSLGDDQRAGYPVKTRVANASEEQRWPECAPFRERERWEWQRRPHLLWVRVDVAEKLREP